MPLSVQSRGRVVERGARGDPLRMVGTMVSLSTALAAPFSEDHARRALEEARYEAAPSLALPLGALDDGMLAQVADLLDFAARHIE